MADRFDRVAVMLGCDLVRGALMGALALVVAVSGPVVLALAICFLSTLAATPYSPAVAGVLPATVPEDDLAAANAAFSAIEYLALAVFPALGGALLLIGPPWVAILIDGATFIVSAVCVSQLRHMSAGGADVAEVRSFMKEVVEGLRVTFGSSDVTILVGAIFLVMLLYGHESVYFILVSRRFIGTGSHGVGFLLGAAGVGGLVGAVLSARATNLYRAGTMLVLAVSMSGIAIMMLSIVRNAPVAYSLVALDGLGGVVIDVVAVTMLQRTVHKAVVSRVIGVLHSVAVTGVLIGTAVAPILLHALGLQFALVVAGGILPAAALCAAPQLRALERKAAAAREAVDPIVSQLRGLLVFAGASNRALESLARAATHQDIPEGTDVVREGEPSEAFFVITSGQFDVSSSGDDGGAASVVNHLGPGDYFGEIGLFYRTKRTATVRSRTQASVYRVPATDFLEAVSFAPNVATMVSNEATRRYAATHPITAAGS